LHAVALAGGVVRSETGSFLAADASRETARLQTSSEELKRLLSARARFGAERKGSKEIAAAPELVELTGETEAKRLITAENEILRTGLETIERDRTALTASIELSDKEIALLERQLGEIKLQRSLRDKQLTEAQSLIGRGLTTQQRVIDSQLAISLLDRDNLEANAGISRAKQTRQKAMRDLDMLSLDRKSKIEQEIVRIDEQVEKSRVAIRSARKIIQQITGLPASMQTPTGTEPVLAYQVMRKTADGTTETIVVDEQSALEPGDILKVTPRVNQISTGSNR
jgi:exopolysaccharide production protein ExoF